MIVFVLRHADRTDDDALTEAGKVRAELLARMLGESGIRTAFCSTALRAQATLQPLQAVLGNKLKVIPVEIGNTEPQFKKHEQDIITAVQKLPADMTAAVISHSNTVRPIIKGLTDVSIGKIEETEFDKLFVLSIPATGAATVTLLRYGEKTPLPAPPM